MKTIKVIDLLNMIAKGEEIPKKVKYRKLTWEYDLCCEDYRDSEGDLVFSFSHYDIISILNDEVEIIEEPKKIEKYHEFLDTSSSDMKSLRSRVNELTDSINEIIDVLNKIAESGGRII